MEGDPNGTLVEALDVDEGALPGLNVLLFGL